MASFIDRPERLTNFSPYVQQMPIEAMVSTGVARQQKYDQGLQRIQQQIDSVAGMDIVRDVDKNYLQSKLHQLTGDLKMVAAADFSNYQLTNAVGGMVNNIGRDENVINAVTSTSRYRKELERGEMFKKSGKWSVNREYDFNRGVEDWMNNSEVGAQFGGRYVEHTDVNKKVVDYISKLVPNADFSDSVSFINPDGTIDTKRIAAVMTRSGVKEVDEGKIRTMLNAVLDSNDLDELSSQGRYNYRGASSEQLKDMAIQTYSSLRSEYAQKLDKLKQRRALSNDVSQQIELNNSIRYFETQLGLDGAEGQLEDYYAGLIKTAYENPDAARANIFTRNWMEQIANGFAYREVDQKLMDSPYEKIRQFEEELTFKKIQERNDQIYRAETLRLKGEENQIEAAKVGEMRKANREIGAPVWDFGGDPVKKEQDALKNWDKNNDELKQRNIEILTTLAKARSNGSTKVTGEQVAKMIEDSKTSNAGFTPDDTSLITEYKRNQSALNDAEYIRKEKEQEVRNDINEQANQYIEQSKIPINNLPGVSVRLQNGEVRSYTANQVVAALSKGRYVVGGSGALPRGGAGTLGTSIYQYPDPNNLTDDELILLDHLKRTGNTRNPLSGVYKTSEGKLIENTVNDLYSITNNNNFDELLSEKMSDYTGQFASQVSPLSFKDETAKKNFENALSARINSDVLQKGGSMDYKPKELGSVIGEEGTDYYAKRIGDKYYVAVTKKGDAKNTQFVPVSSNVMREYFGEDWIEQNINLAETMLKGNGKTNYSGKYEYAYYPTETIGSIVKGSRTVTLPVAIDLEKGSVGGLYPVLRMKIGGEPINVRWTGQPVNLFQFENIDLPSLTNEKILSEFEKTYPNIRELVKQYLNE